MDQDNLLSHRRAGEEDIQMVPLSYQPSKLGDGCICATPVAPGAKTSGPNDFATGTTGHDTRTAKQKKAERIQLMALFWFAFLVGWNDGSTGPLLPRIQEVYHVTKTSLSSINLSVDLSLTSGQLYNRVYDFHMCLWGMCFLFLCTQSSYCNWFNDFEGLPVGCAHEFLPH